MINVLSVNNMRESDAATIAGGTPGVELMARAAKAVFEAVEWRAPVAVVCGGGNNAGDGYALAELFSAAGIGCTVFRLNDKTSRDGAYYLDRCLGSGADVRRWEGDDLSVYHTVVDCILGTGFKGTVEGTFACAVRAINESGAFVVSVDINSGLDGDSGMGEPCVFSDLTVAIGSFKPGHFLNRAKDVMRQKIACDIGIPPVYQPFRLLEASDSARAFPPRLNFSHKGTYGYTALIGGSVKYTGAVRLAAMASAAMRSGAGVVRVAFPQSLYQQIVPSLLEATAFPLPDADGGILFDADKMSELIRGVKTVAYGMGVGLSDGASAALSFLLKEFTGRLIVDADGLTLLSRLDREEIKGASCSLFLTPHIGEFSRLTGKTADGILSSPIDSAKEYAASVGAVVLLKGPSTVVTDGERVYIVDAGCPGMATAGSGDVLSGILSAVLSTADDPLLGTAAGAYINGKAGEAAQQRYGAISMISSDTVSCIPDIIKNI